MVLVEAPEWVIVVSVVLVVRQVLLELLAAVVKV
jgi:hypothetical protein